jgi:hypothetical protein
LSAGDTLIMIVQKALDPFSWLAFRSERSSPPAKMSIAGGGVGKPAAGQPPFLAFNLVAEPASWDDREPPTAGNLLGSHSGVTESSASLRTVISTSPGGGCQCHPAAFRKPAASLLEGARQIVVMLAADAKRRFRRFDAACGH